MKVIQIGANKAYDNFSNYIVSNYNNLEFGLFVEPNTIHIESIKKCYEKYENVFVENLAIKLPGHNGNDLTIYYHTSDPDYQIASCNIEHIEKHLEWAKNNNIHLYNSFKDGQIKSFTVDCITLEELFDKYSIVEVDWLYLDIEGIDAEILLTFDFQKYKIKRVEFEHLHLGQYKNAVKNMFLGLGYIQVNSLHEYDWAFENKNILFNNEIVDTTEEKTFIDIDDNLIKFANLIKLDTFVESSQETLSKYFCHLQKILNPESTFEVGAFDADFSKKIKKQNPKVDCWAFEANPYNFEYFSKDNHFYYLGINYINLAVSSETDEIDFYLQDKILLTNEEIDKIRGNNSILNRCDENISYISTRIKSISLNDFFKNFNLVDKTKSLWIDVEGASKNVLMGCSESFENVLSIMIEVENKEYWKDQWFSNDVIQYLEQKGFYPIMRDYWIDNYQYNIVFLNRKIIDNKSIFEKIINLVNDYLKEINLDKKSYAVEEKLKNFPSINFISIEESVDRRKILYENFEKYNIKKVTPHIFQRYNDDEHNVIGKDVDILAPKTHRGPVTSHLKAIRHWYENTDEEYTIFCEDDMSFETVQYWNFTWDEFFNSLPQKWECVQLSLTSTHQIYFDRVIHQANNKMRPRDWCDWSCVVYLMRRSHAKKILDNYYYDNIFCLEYKGWDLQYRLEVGERWPIIPNIETLAYSTFNDKSYVYTCALFVENLNFSTTWGDYNGISYLENYTDNIHLPSYQNILEWWRTKGQFLPLNQIVDLNYINLWSNQ